MGQALHVAPDLEASGLSQGGAAVEEGQAAGIVIDHVVDFHSVQKPRRVRDGGGKLGGVGLGHVAAFLEQPDGRRRVGDTVRQTGFFDLGGTGAVQLGVGARLYLGADGNPFARDGHYRVGIDGLGIVLLCGMHRHVQFRLPLAHLTGPAVCGLRRFVNGGGRDGFCADRFSRFFDGSACRVTGRGGFLLR